MTTWEPIDYSNPVVKVSTVYGICPICGGGIIRGRIPCPDGDTMCLVLHFGYRCSICRTVLKKFEEEVK